MDCKDQERGIRRWIIFFMIALAVSGITAFALETELRWLLDLWEDANGGGVVVGRLSDANSGSAQVVDAGDLGSSGGLYFWIRRVYLALKDTNGRYPFMAYGYDWLAFAHLVIAVAFIGPLRDPIRNKWVIEFGMIACVMVFPLAFIAGAVRGIPIYWRLIDCSFGAIGLAPLGICYRRIQVLEKMRGAN